MSQEKPTINPKSLERGVLMIIKGDAVINNPVKLSQKNIEGEKAGEAFKKLFVEKMVSEMFKSTVVIPGTSEFEKEVYTEKMSEVLTDKLLQSTDIRWEQLLGNHGIKSEEE